MFVDGMLTFSAGYATICGMRRPTLAVLPYRHSRTHRYYLDLRPFGQGRKFFKTRAEAEAERLRQLTLRERGGREAIGLPLDELSDIVKARRKLSAHGKSLTDAATFYLDYLEKIRRCNVTVAELTKEVLEAKRRDGHAPMYIADLRKRLIRFCRNFGDRPIAGITVEELDNWLRDLDCAPKSRANFRANVGVLFSYAERRRMIDSNPILRTARPKLPNNAPEIFRVDELSGLLDTANRLFPDLLSALAIGAFAASLAVLGVGVQGREQAPRLRPVRRWHA